MVKFENEQNAAKAVLLEVCALLNKETVDYAVIGGWIPYLFNSSPLLHPGTFDVDIVLNSNIKKEIIIRALDRMIYTSGYMRAPKNAFQIYRVLNVLEEPMVFHVDFLHRKYADDTDGMILQWGRYETIQGPGTDIIFLEKQLRNVEITGYLPDGEEATVTIPFATEVGFLSCKGRSVGFGKRTRDAYDVFLVIEQTNDRELLVKSAKLLLEKSAIFKTSMSRLQTKFQEDEVLTQAADWSLKLNPHRFNTPGDPKDPKVLFTAIEIEKQFVSKVITDFVNEIGLKDYEE